MGSGPRSSMENKGKNPGPGQYKSPSKTEDGPRYQFGLKTASAFTSYSRHVPGPGQYTPRNNTLSKVSYSMPGKSEYQSAISGKKKLAPGPGQYDSRSDFSKTAGNGFGRE